MQKYFRLLVIIVISIISISCSSIDLNEKRCTEFKSNQDVELFYMSVPQLLESNGYSVETIDVEVGKLESKFEGKDFSIEINIKFDKETRTVKIITKNTITKDNSTIIEYYNLDDYNSDYEKYFYLTLSSIRSNATKTSFPNR